MINYFTDMKTNVQLESSSRNLLGKTITVMSKDGFVCITEAMDALNEKRALMGLKARRIDDILQTKSFQERLPALIREISSMEFSDSEYSKVCDNCCSFNSINDLRKLKMAYRRGGRHDQKWFVNPYVFVMIALELDPEIYAKVIVWLTDGLIGDRNAAGEAYLRMSRSISSIVPDKSELKDKIQRVAKGINYIIFNEHEDNRRNRASKNEMMEIVALENAIIEFIDSGYIKSFDELINFLGNKWRRKWGNHIDKLMR